MKTTSSQTAKIVVLLAILSGDHRAVGAADMWQFVLAWGISGSVEDIAVDPDGLVYVLDKSNGRIQVFTPDGQFLREKTGFVEPTGIAVDAKGVIYLQLRCRVARYTPEFQLLDNWDSCNGMGDLQENLSIDVADSVVWVGSVADVLKFTPEGTFLGRFMANMTFTGVDARSDGSIWVSIEYGSSGLVRHYASDGQLLGEWSPRLPGEQVSTPFDIDSDSTGNVYVSDGQIKMFTSDGSVLEVLSPALGSFVDVELDGDDTLYAGKALPSQVVRFHRAPMAVERMNWGEIKWRYR